MSDNRGLVLVFAEPGADTSLDEFNDWYDKEHAPSRLTVPGFRSAIRYKATDGQAPSWVAAYELESPAAAQSEAYKAVANKASDKEKALFSQLSSLDRRVYELYSLRIKPDLPASTFPGKYLLVVAILVPAALDAEFNKWYEEEHVGEITKTPGWQRCRRYKLVAHTDLTGKGDPSKRVQNYLALHDFDNNDYVSTPEFIAACSTPWTNKIREGVEDVSIRTFSLYKTIQN